MTPYPDIWFVVMGVGFFVLFFGLIATGVYFLVREIVRVVRDKLV